jgi:hypothetical protein
MIQLRFYPLDDIQITLKINRSEARFAAANVVATVDRYTEIADPCLHMTEFVIIQDRSAYVSCINPTNYALSMSRICFFGFRYVLKDFSVALPNKDAVRKLYPNVVYVDSSNY